MSTISLILEVIFGSMRMAMAMFVSGPVGTRVISPSDAISVLVR